MFGRKKIYNCKKLIHVFKIAWVKESTLCVNSFLKNYFCKKVCSFCEKRTSKIWDVLFLLSYLPPLSDFVLFCLTPPTPPKIGHHLCMFPNVSNLSISCANMIAYYDFLYIPYTLAEMSRNWLRFPRHYTMATMSLN